MQHKKLVKYKKLGKGFKKSTILNIYIDIFNTTILKVLAYLLNLKGTSVLYFQSMYLCRL